ncbi:MAG: hypothetical protein JWN70_5565 [Planctomycetaceae bacterium]|nr:hypothetical protein [Planctomycetaceae bacterium]
MAKKNGEKTPSRQFDAAEVEAMSSQLREAADNLSAAAALLDEHEIPGAYFHLSNLQNTLISKVLVYARDAKGLAEDEVRAKQAGTVSERTKNVLRYQEGVATEAPGYLPRPRTAPAPAKKKAAPSKKKR